MKHVAHHARELLQSSIGRLGRTAREPLGPEARERVSRTRREPLKGFGRRGAVLALAVVAGGSANLLVSSCGSRTRGPTIAGEPSERVGVLVPRTNVPDFGDGGPPVPAQFADRLWRDAERGDSLDLERLANRESAAGLLDAIEFGHVPGRVALRALPSAPDAELALRRLCDIVKYGGESSYALVLPTIHAIVAEPLPPTERLDPTSRGDCRGALMQVSESGSVSAQVRDLAQSSLVFIGERSAR